MPEPLEIVYLHYTGANAETEAQAACDLCHELASRPASEGGINGYVADKYADPIPHPDDTGEFIVPFDVERATYVGIPTDIQTRLDNRAKLTVAEVEAGGWFPDPDNDLAGSE